MSSSVNQYARFPVESLLILRVYQDDLVALASLAYVLHSILPSASFIAHLSFPIPPPSTLSLLVHLLNRQVEKGVLGLEHIQHKLFKLWCSFNSCHLKIPQKTMRRDKEGMKAVVS